MSSRFTSNQGMISIQALWLLMILTIMAAGLIVRTTLGIALTVRDLELAKAESLATSYASIVRERIAVVDTIDCNYRGCSFLEPDSIFLVIGLDSFNVLFRPGLLVSTDPGSLMADEEAKLNINTIPEFVLQNLFENQLQVTSVINYRSRKMSDSTEYCGPFATIDELSMIPGFTVNDVIALRPLLTTYGSGKVNLNSASDEVLSKIGCPQSLIAKLGILHSAKQGSIEYESERTHITSVATLISQLITSGQIVTANEANFLKDMSNYELLGTTSSYFSYTITCNEINSSTPIIISQVVSKQIDDSLQVVQTLAWR